MTDLNSFWSGFGYVKFPYYDEQIVDKCSGVITVRAIVQDPTKQKPVLYFPQPTHDDSLLGVAGMQIKEAFALLSDPETHIVYQQLIGVSTWTGSVVGTGEPWHCTEDDLQDEVMEVLRKKFPEEKIHLVTALCSDPVTIRGLYTELQEVGLPSHRMANPYRIGAEKFCVGCLKEGKKERRPLKRATAKGWTSRDVHGFKVHFCKRHQQRFNPVWDTLEPKFAEFTVTKFDLDNAQNPYAHVDAVDLAGESLIGKPTTVAGDV